MITINKEKIYQFRKPTEKQIKFADDLIARVNGWLEEARAIEGASPTCDAVEKLLTLRINSGMSPIAVLKDETKVTILGECARCAGSMGLNRLYETLRKAQHAEGKKDPLKGYRYEI